MRGSTPLEATKTQDEVTCFVFFISLKRKGVEPLGVDGDPENSQNFWGVSGSPKTLVVFGVPISP